MDVIWWVGAVAGAIGINLIASELFAWGPRLSEWLMHRAVRRLVPELRDRMQEEWAGHLQMIPPGLWRIVAAAGFYLATGQINVALRVHLLEMWLGRNERRIRELLEQLGQDRSELRDATGRLDLELSPLGILDGRGLLDADEIATLQHVQKRGERHVQQSRELLEQIVRCYEIEQQIEKGRYRSRR
jgi:hypothetical protein